MQVPLIRLECGCNSYEWGKVGDESAAAKFAAATNLKIEQDKPYAELWMGTHPSLPSKDLETGRTLLDMVHDNQALVSHAVARRYGNRIPFLFKVLSITKALSIQAHPNKKLAERLHEKDSEHYPDDNHKPEMAIAITQFEGLCGFRPLTEICHFLKTVPPLRELIGSSTADSFINVVSNHEENSSSSQTQANKEALKSVFSAVMSCATSSDKLEPATASLVSFAESSGSDFASGGGPSPNSGRELSELILRLHSQFPSDIGLFVLFFLNYVKLEPGEAMFLRADEIHAYLSGDIMECMAESDNVVRAGFTPKFKDVDTLVDMLTYSYAPIEEQKMQPQDYMYVKLDRKAYSGGSSCILYDPPIEEFSVVKTELAGNGKATFEAVQGPSIIICTQGAGSISVGNKRDQVKEGYVFFVGATAECILEAQGDVVFVTFKAFCELEEMEFNGARSNGSL